MNLIAVKKYFSKHPVASAMELAAYFDLTPSDVACYIAHWERRGNLIPCTKSCASGCDLCYRHDHLYYTWKES